MHACMQHLLIAAASTSRGSAITLQKSLRPGAARAAAAVVVCSQNELGTRVCWRHSTTSEDHQTTPRHPSAIIFTFTFYILHSPRVMAFSNLACLETHMTHVKRKVCRSQHLLDHMSLARRAHSTVYGLSSGENRGLQISCPRGI